MQAEPRRRPLEPREVSPPARSRRGPRRVSRRRKRVPGVCRRCSAHTPSECASGDGAEGGLGLFQWRASLLVGSAPLPQPRLPRGPNALVLAIAGWAVGPSPQLPPQLRRPAPAGLGGRVWEPAERGEYSTAFAGSLFPHSLARPGVTQLLRWGRREGAREERGGQGGQAQP